MNKKILILSILIVFVCRVHSQEIKTDTRFQIQKDDPFNMYRSDLINTIDLLKALDLADIRIFKYNIGKFDRKYKLHLFIDEYQEREIIKSDSFYTSNVYDYFLEGRDEIYSDYIDHINIYTNLKDSKLILSIETNIFSYKKPIEYKTINDQQFYNLRSYSETLWKINQKIPMLIFASSWEDKEYNTHRFCGATDLSLDINQTNELLSLSPHYFIISYKISEY